MANALHNHQRDDRAADDRVHAEVRTAEIEEIARVTESQVRTWGWLRSLSAGSLDRPRVDAIVYPSTMAGAASLVHRLESSGIAWQPIGQTGWRRSRSDGGLVLISLRLLDEHLIFDGERIRVHGGYSVSALAYAAGERGLEGLESLTELGGGLGELLRPDLRGELWRLVEEIVVAKQDSLKVILTRGDELTPEQRRTMEGGLVLAATLRLARRDQGRRGQQAGGPEILVSATSVEEDPHLDGGEGTASELIPLTERMRNRAAQELQLELEYDVDVWRDEAEEG